MLKRTSHGYPCVQGEMAGMRRTLQVLLYSTLLVGGCFRSPPARLYSLQPLPSGLSRDISNSSPRIQIAVETFPSYLSNPQIALRTATGEIVLDEYNRWVEEGKVNFERILLEDLSTRLNTSGIFIAPAYDKRDVDYLLRAEVVQFDLSQTELSKAEEAVLKVRWALAAPKGSQLPSFTISVFKESVPDSSPANRVLALSKVLAAFSDQVAERVLHPLNNGRYPHS